MDLGFEGFDLSPVARVCEDLDVPHTIVHTDIGKIVFQDRAEQNPCALCAKMRKGALNQAVCDMHFTKVAYAHSRDDLVETMLLSLIYEGRFYCFPPKTYLDRTRLTVIRPLLYLPEADIVGFRNKYDLPVVPNPCPADGHTRREYAKQLLKTLENDNPGVKNRLFTAIVRSNLPGWDPDQADTAKEMDES